MHHLVLNAKLCIFQWSNTLSIPCNFFSLSFFCSNKVQIGSRQVEEHKRPKTIFKSRISYGFFFYYHRIVTTKWYSPDFFCVDIEKKELCKSSCNHTENKYPHFIKNYIRCTLIILHRDITKTNKKIWFIAFDYAWKPQWLLILKMLSLIYHTT